MSPSARDLAMRFAARALPALMNMGLNMAHILKPRTR